MLMAKEPEPKGQAQPATPPSSEPKPGTAHRPYVPANVQGLDAQGGEQLEGIMKPMSDKDKLRLARIRRLSR